MKKIALLSLAFFFSFLVTAQENEETLGAQIDSIESSLTYETGTIELKNGIAKIKVPVGFKYLNAEQSKRVLIDIWGNPPSTAEGTLGMILPENAGVLDETGYVFNIEYDEIGYVKDDDADEVNYDDLLKQMQEESIEENKQRTEAGYQTIQMVGWASKPFYDKERKILHWAKEIKFGENEVNTLNYNVRILGRKGVLILNAIAQMPELALVQKDIKQVMNIVEFNEGNKYSDFDPSVDEVAAWTIGGLVAGKVLAKVGFFAVILKFWKVIAIGVVAFFGAFWKKITGRRKEPEVAVTSPKKEDGEEV